MAWTANNDGTYTHAGTTRDVFVGNGSLPQFGTVWLRIANKTSNVKGVLLSDPGGFNCWEAGIEGANCVIRKVTKGTEAAAVATAAHGIGASTPFTMRVDIEGTVIKVFINGVLPAVVSYDVSAAAEPNYLDQSGYGFVSKINSGIVLQAFSGPLLPNTLPATKVLVWVVNGDLWYAIRDPGTGIPRAALGKARALSATGQISSAEFEQKLYLCDGQGNHIVFDASVATPTVTDWVRTGITDDFYLLCAHQARLFGVPTTDKQNAYGSAVNDPTDYDTGSDLPGAAYGLTESDMPKIGEPIRAMFPASRNVLIFGCSRSFYQNIGDPALGGFDVVSITHGIGASGPRCMFLNPMGEVVAHTTDGWCKIVGGAMLPISKGGLTEGMVLPNPIDTHAVSVVRDSRYFGAMIFLTPKVPFVALHWWYDERTGGYRASDSPESFGGGFWPVDMPAAIGPSAVCDWDGVIVLGGRDGKLRTYNPGAYNHDGVVINWRMPVMLAAATDLDYDTIIDQCTVVRAEWSGDFNIVFYGGRTAEEAIQGAGRTLLLRRKADERVTQLAPEVRAPAVVLEFSSLSYNTPGILEAVQIVTTAGELTKFCRTPATETPFGASVNQGGTQVTPGSSGPGSGPGPGAGAGSGIPAPVTPGGEVPGTGAGIIPSQLPTGLPPTGSNEPGTVMPMPVLTTVQGVESVPLPTSGGGTAVPRDRVSYPSQEGEQTADTVTETFDAGPP